MAEPITEAVLRDALAEAPSAFEVPGATPAGVVIPVRFDRGAEAIAVLRAPTLRDHGGEVGFPGGKPEPGDADLVATALRELEEEVGVAPADVEVIGALTPVPVISRKYLIHAFVAIARPGAPFRVASSEVADLVTLPLDALIGGARRHAVVRVPWRPGGELSSVPHFWLEAGDRLGDGSRGGGATAELALTAEGDGPEDAAARVALYGASAYLFMDLLRRLARRLGVAMPEPDVEERLPWGDRYRRYEGRPGDG